MPLYPTNIKFIDYHDFKLGGAIFIDKSNQIENYSLLHITFDPTNVTNDQ